MTRLLTALASAALLLAGCADPAAPSSTPLVGRWAAAPEPLSPQGSLRTELSFTADGRFRSELRLTGVYSGPADELSAYRRTVGTFRTEGDRLHLAVETVTIWDRFYGADSPEQVERPAPGGGPYDGARFEIDGDRLTLFYLTYPADAPVPTTQRLRRVR